MVSIPLKIALHGLIALVPAIDPSGHMTALLVDARTPPHNMECMSSHHPRLEFVVVEPSECFAVRGCKAVGNRCSCKYYKDNEGKDVEPLLGKQISLKITPPPTLAAEKPTGDLPARSVPADEVEASSFSYVANLSQTPFALAIDPDYLASAPSAAARNHLVARMDFPYKEIAACALATREDGGQANVHAIAFRKLHGQSQRGEMSYALAQLVVARLTVPDPGPGGTQVVQLGIGDFGDPNPTLITLLKGVDGYKIEVSNEPEQKLNPDDLCDDGVARHFDAFYDLALNKPTDHLLPHVRPTQFKGSETLQPTICKDPTFQFMDRPICPMASFNP